MDTSYLKGKMATRVRYNPDEPGIPQVYRMGKSYGPWSYKPLTGFGADDSILIIGGPLEKLTHVPVWMPAVWGLVALVLFAYTWINDGFLFAFESCLLGAVTFWPLTEYALHRWILHIPTESGNGVLNVIHFLLHGIHHKTPQDSSRLLAPLPMILALATPIYMMMRLVLSFETTLALWSGLLIGYVQYDYTHLYLHMPGKKSAWIRQLVKSHRNHHQHQHHKFYGISYPSNFIWDYIFGTQ